MKEFDNKKHCEIHSSLNEKQKRPQHRTNCQIKDTGSRVFQGFGEGSDHSRPVSQKQNKTKVIEEMRDGTDFSDFYRIG